MKVSGYTFVRDADRYYLPIDAAIRSVLPLVDEFVVALGEGAEGDTTRAQIEAIGSNKIRIVPTVWDTTTFGRNTEYARQSDLAKVECSGDWLFYIQGDEALGEWDHALVREQLAACLNRPEIEGFLFHYRHFWGDYRHYQQCNRWYPREIRIIRNRPEIHSWRDAQSFRVYDGPCLSQADYERKQGTRKLTVMELDAWMFHYGYVRPPELMSSKSRRMHETYHGTDSADKVEAVPDRFHYGRIDRLPVYDGPHPAPMAPWLERFNWGEQLHAPPPPGRSPHAHEQPKYRALTWVEQRLLGGRRLGGFRNYRIVDRAGATGG